MLYVLKYLSDAVHCHFTKFALSGSVKTWDAYKKIPVCTLRTAFARFLDITTPPSQTLLKIISAQATKDCDREKIENLTNVSSQIYILYKMFFLANMLYRRHTGTAVKIRLYLINSSLREPCEVLHSLC